MFNIYLICFILFCLQCFKADSHVFNKFTFGTVTTVVETHSNRYTQVLQYLQFGVIFIRMRTQSVNVVFCRTGTEKMLQFNRSRIGRVVLEMEEFRKVSH